MPFAVELLPAAARPNIEWRGVPVLTGFLTTIMAFILILKSREALTKDYRRTEMWLYLPKELRPPQTYAQWASATVLRETYLTFAQWTAGIAIGIWMLALAFSVLTR